MRGSVGPRGASVRQVDHLRDRLIEWCEIPSGSADGAGLGAMAEVLRDAFGEITSAVEHLDLDGALAPVMRARARPDAPVQVLLVGHYDTVYTPDDGFDHCTLIDDDTLGGPGVADMKGGLVVMHEALARFEESLAREALGWEVLVVPDEEIGSPASFRIVREAAARHHFGLVFEPALPDGRVVRARMGTGHIEITAHGRAAHAGRDPAAGRNAIVALADLIATAGHIGDDADGVLMNVGVISGGGAVNVVPDHATALINLRATSTEAAEVVVGALRLTAVGVTKRHEVTFTIEGGLTRPPKLIDAATKELFARYRAAGAARGVTIRWVDVAGGSDGSNMAHAGLPTLDGLGVVGDGIHSPREHCRISSIAERAGLVTDLLVDLAGG
jgi:glutamate carboxypeptidase